MQDTVVGALDECKCILVSTSWAGSFYGKGLQTVGIQCLGAYATMRLSYKNYNTAIKCQLSQAAPIANSSWAAKAPLDTSTLFGFKVPFFSNSLSNMSNETDSAMCSEGHQFLTGAPPKFNRALIPLPI